MSARRLLVLAKKSALRAHQEGRDQGLHDRVELLLRRDDLAVARMRGAHEEHEATLQELHEAIASLGCHAEIVTADALDEFKNVATHRHDLVVTVGGDGTLLAASHCIDDRPVLAINSAPGFSVGFFCGGKKGSVRRTLERALRGELPEASLTRMQVQKNGKIVTRHVLNEVLLCSTSPAATSRYILEYRKRVEEQKSSGIWIGPAAGSTAAQRSAGGRVLSLQSNALQFVVREPYTPAGESLRFVRGIVLHGDALVVRPKMTDGRIFVDGPHEVYPISIGDVLRFSASDEPLRLLGVLRRSGWLRQPSRRPGRGRR